MRIALITPGFSAYANDWAIPALLNLTRALARRHEIHVFSQRYPPEGHYHFDGLTHHALGGGQKFGLASLRLWLHTAQAITQQHRQTPFDLLHAFWADEAGFSAALAGAWLKRPVLVSLGGGELIHRPDLAYGAQRFLTRRLTTRLALQRASLTTAGSNYQLDLCRAHHLPQSKLRLAPLGVDTDLFQPAHPLTSKVLTFQPANFQPPTLVQAASFLPVKNQSLLLQILSLVKLELPAIKLNLAGSGPLQAELQHLARHLKIEDNIAWRQYLPYPQIPALYQESHLYLQTSHHESQGMAVLEAMACSRPALGTPVGVAREVAALPAQFSAEALAAQVVEVFKDETRYHQMGQQARQTVEARYSLAVVTDTFSTLYQEKSQ
jgi:glycosyltransferase involved in cell wall biosynthesis